MIETLCSKKLSIIVSGRSFSCLCDHDLEPVCLTGSVYHVTSKPQEWWRKKLLEHGLEMIDGLMMTEDFPRGYGNPCAMDWSARQNPEMGFHIVARLKH